MKKIFISYSHKDEEWKEKLVTHLRVIEKQGCCETWDDTKVAAGNEWLSEIQKAIESSHIAILMISANFLTSNFILKKEIPELFERRKKYGLKIMPFIIKPCAWQKVKWLNQIQARPKDGRALIRGNECEIEEDLSYFVQEIDDILNQISFAEQDKTKNYARFPKIDTTKLPPTDSKLFGEEKELESDKSQIIKIVPIKGVDSFNFIHISDLHFGTQHPAYSDRYDSRLLKAYPYDEKTLYQDLTESLNAWDLKLQPNACIVSGDLVEKCENSDHYKEVFYNLKELSSRWFNGNNDQFIIIPGNHDVQWADKFKSDKRTAEAYKRALALFYKDPSIIMDEENFLWDIKLFECNNFKVLICGFDSTLIETVSRLGIGYISNKQRDDIEKAMREKDLIDDPNCIKIAVLHHHVLPVLHDIVLETNNNVQNKPTLEGSKASLTYDARDFLRWLTKNNFSLVLHGHQHIPFITTEHERSENQNEILVVGAGSVSKWMNEDKTSSKVNNFFNFFRLSPDKGIDIFKFQANKIGVWGFDKTDEWHFPIYHNGMSISNNMADIIDNLLEKYETEKLVSTGTAFINKIDVTANFQNNTIAQVLREILICYGVLKIQNDKILIEYHIQDKLPFSFLKILARHLRNRGKEERTIFSDWADYPRKKHQNLLSSLIFLAGIEKRWYDSFGLKDVTLRKERYILYPLFARKNNVMQIYLYLHDAWSVYLIPTLNSKEKENVSSVFDKYKYPFKKGFSANRDLEKLKDECIFTDIIEREPKPSPSRGTLTQHIYDMYFYSLKEEGFKKLESKGTNWEWFSLEKCCELKHVHNQLELLEKEYLYHSKDGLFPNNLDIIKFAFEKAEHLEKNGLLKIYEI